MRTAAGRPFRRFGVALLFAVSIGSGLQALPTGAAQDPMDDMCAGDMLWMIGWCLDMVMPGDSVDLPALASDAGRVYDGEILTLDVPGAGATRAFGTNAQGDIVGSYGPPGQTHGFLLRDGVYFSIDYPNSTSTEAWGINARGDIIGRYTIAGRGGVLGFILSRGRFTDISIPSATGPGGKHLITLPTKIGASGEIVGCFHDMSTLRDMFGYVQRGGEILATFALPSTQGPAAVMHNGITPGGTTIVGFVNEAPGRTRGYVITNDELTYIDGPGAAITQAWDVNPNGIVVGQYDAGGRTHGFYLDDDGLVTLDVPNSSMTVARGVNPRGDIVGVYNDATGTHGFVTRR
jgi:uncharacterized membrane protein